MIGPTACVIGWPLAHSRSPLIHRHWLKVHRLTGDYIANPVEPDRIDAFLADFARGRFVGANVTIPYKENAFRASQTDAEAAALGAVNTLWVEDGRLFGTNTDTYGFLANLDAAAPGWSEAGGTAVVLGAGGAARAVLWSLLARGFDPVVVVNRSAERAEELRRRFGPRVTPASPTALADWLRRASILVNATSLGMTGQPPLEIDVSHLPETALVHDLVYAPLETGLLSAARARGLHAVDGLGMLLHQAVPGFEKWFGVRPAVTGELRDLIVADLSR